MKGFVLLVVICVLMLPARGVAGPVRTWTGVIRMGEPCGVKMTQVCGERLSRYFFVSHGRYFNMANQKFSGLRALVGRRVVVTGEVDGRVLTILEIMVP